MDEDTRKIITQLKEEMQQLNLVKTYICPLCEKEVKSLIRHHYCYFPEKTILLCNRCNKRNFLEANHPLLNPSLKDAKMFRKKGKNAKKCAGKKKIEKEKDNFHAQILQNECNVAHNVLKCKECQIYPCDKLLSDGKDGFIFSEEKYLQEFPIEDVETRMTRLLQLQNKKAVQKETLTVDEEKELDILCKSEWIINNHSYTFDSNIEMEER